MLKYKANKYYFYVKYKKRALNKCMNIFKKVIIDEYVFMKLDQVYNNVNHLIFEKSSDTIIDKFQYAFYNLTSLTLPDITKLTSYHMVNRSIESIKLFKEIFPNITSLSLGNKFNECVDTLKTSFPNLKNLSEKNLITNQ